MFSSLFDVNNEWKFLARNLYLYVEVHRKRIYELCWELVLWVQNFKYGEGSKLLHYSWQIWRKVNHILDNIMHTTDH